MNWAFSAVLFILLLLPGLSFRIAYLSSPYGRTKISTSLADEIVFALVPALVLQTMFILLWNTGLYALNGWVASPSTALTLLSPDKASEDVVRQVNAYFYLFVLHTLGLVALGALAGYGCRKLVRMRRWDERRHWLRSENKWYYIFKIDDIIRANGITIVDALVKTSEGDAIYTGTLREFNPERNDKLEGIYIDTVSRRLLKNDVSSEGGPYARTHYTRSHYYHIPGKSFYIPMAHIANLNIWYFQLKEV